MTPMQATGRRQPSRPRALPRGAMAAAAAVAALAILMYGGYDRDWRWTGINENTATLWDWLHLLLLPLAAGILPIAVRRRGQLRTRHQATALAALSAFAVLVLAGYAIPWQWTGFPGNKLWDWLELLALPLAIALIPLVRELHANWEPRHRLTLLAGVLGFAGFVTAAYLAGWSWTGFRGNTVWDWLHLLLLPLLVPAIAVPELRRATTNRLPDVDEHEDAADDAQDETAHHETSASATPAPETPPEGS